MQNNYARVLDNRMNTQNDSRFENRNNSSWEIFVSDIGSDKGSQRLLPSSDEVQDFKDEKKE